MNDRRIGLACEMVPDTVNGGKELVGHEGAVRQLFEICDCFVQIDIYIIVPDAGVVSQAFWPLFTGCVINDFDAFCLRVGRRERFFYIFLYGRVFELWYAGGISQDMYVCVLLLL